MVYRYQQILQMYNFFIIFDCRLLLVYHNLEYIFFIMVKSMNFQFNFRRVEVYELNFKIPVNFSKISKNNISFNNLGTFITRKSCF